MSGKYSQKLRDNAKNLQQKQLKLLQKKIQKTTEATGNLIGNKIADKITKVSESSLQNSCQSKTNAKRKIYVSEKTANYWWSKINMII